MQKALFACSLGIVTTALVACGGGSYAPSTPGASSALLASNAMSPFGKPPADAIARFVLKIPHPLLDRAHYVSNATHVLRVQVETVNGVAPSKKLIANFATKKGGAGCKPSGEALTCTFTMKVPAGSVQFAISLLESKGASLALGEAVVTKKLRSGKTTTIPFTSYGIPAKIIASVPAISAVNDGGKHTASFSVSAEDASGETIVGPGLYQAVLQFAKTGDNQNALSFTPTDVSGPGTGVTPVTVTYDSSVPLTKPQVSILIYTSTGNALSTTVDFDPLTISPVSLNGFWLGASSQTQTMTVSEPGDTAPFVVTGNSGAVSIVCAPATCAPSSAGGSVQISYSPVSNGSGSVSIADALGATFLATYSVATFSRLAGPAAVGPVANIINGGDGNLWGVVQSAGSGSIVRSTTGGTVTPFPLPSPFNPANSPDGVAGSDGAIWLVDASSPDIYRVSTAVANAGSVTTFATADGANPTSIALAPDQQSLYFTDSAGNIGNVNIATKAVTNLKNSLSRGAAGSSLAIDASGNMYFLMSEEIFRMTPAGVVTQLNDPAIGFEGVTPSLLIIGPDANLWIGAQTGDICDMTPAQKTIGCYPTALTYVMYSLAVGPDGAVWATGGNVNRLSTITRTAVGGATTTFIFPDCCPFANNLTIGPDGALWSASNNGGFDRIGL